MESAGLHPIRVYIKRRKTTIAERVARLPVYALCMDSERIPVDNPDGALVGSIWGK